MAPSSSPAVPREHSTGGDRFPPIGAYAFLSDCERSALVAPDGAIEWLCLPRFDSPSVFAAILDRDAGRLRLGPLRERVPLARRYEPGTNVLETTWATGDGAWLVVRDALVLHPPAPEDGHRLHAAGLLVRTARSVDGECPLRLEARAAADYDRERSPWSLSDGVGRCSGGDLVLELHTDMRLSVEDGALAGERSLREGETAFCALRWSRAAEPPADGERAAEMLADTARAWRQWLDRGRFPDHAWRAELQRSALTLKGLTHAPTGATVAAATTSLPETPGGERNWDYRYTWIRDASFTLWGLHILGFDSEAIDFMDFVAKVCRAEGPGLQIMYGIDGRKQLPESTLDHLSGYEGAQPVRIGNAAHTQRQNDVYGALLDSIYLHGRAREHLPEQLWGVVSDQVAAAAGVWREPDQGIWEARGAPRHYTSSKLMCWVALDRGARLAERRGEDELARGWQAEATEIRAEILARGVSDRGVFRQHYETDALDASTLLVPLVRFLPPTDERVRRTVLTIADELDDQGLILRYRVEETDDGLRGAEGTFSICSFWMVSALSEIGEAERASALCERLLSLAGALGLYAEEIEPSSDRQLGNFPQAFTHLALVNAVSHVIVDERAGGGGAGGGAFNRLRG